ncbi:MAG: HAMP domain-containing sensor histidine kinase [Pseudomonadota bacterium]
MKERPQTGQAHRPNHRPDHRPDLRGAVSGDTGDVCSDNLAARVRHDLLQPVAAMKMLTARFRDDMPAEERVALANAFAASIEDLEGAIDQISTHLFLRHGVLTPVFEPTNLDAWIVNVAAPHKERMHAAGLALTIDAAAGRQSIDDPLLRIILEAALDNAFQFTPSGTIVLRARGVGNGFTLTVSDSGVGLPDEPMERLCAPFYVQNAEAGRATTRLGLGLSNASDAAAIIGGTIDLKAGDDRGAVFTFAS